MKEGGIRVALDLGDSTEFIQLMPGDDIGEVAAQFCMRHGIDSRVQHAIVEEFRRQIGQTAGYADAGHYFESAAKGSQEEEFEEEDKQFMRYQSENEKKPFISENPTRFNNGLYERFMESSQREDLGQVELENTPHDTPMKQEAGRLRGSQNNQQAMTEDSPGKLLKQKLRNSKRHHYQAAESLPMDQSQGNNANKIKKSKTQKEKEPDEVKPKSENPFSHLLAKDRKVESETIDLMSLIQPQSKTENSNSEMQSVKNVEKELHYDIDSHHSEDESQMKEIFETSAYFKGGGKKKKKTAIGANPAQYLHPPSAVLSNDRPEDISMSFSNNSPVKAAEDNLTRRKHAKHDQSRSRSQQPREQKLGKVHPPANVFYDREDEGQEDQHHQDDEDMQRTVAKYLLSTKK